MKNQNKKFKIKNKNAHSKSNFKRASNFSIPLIKTIGSAKCKKWKLVKIK
jgi:hypothetical protein